MPQLEDTWAFDLQLDVDDAGQPSPDFAMEVSLERESLSASPWEDGRAERILSLLEACGAADERWRTLTGADVSRQMVLPTPGGMRPCAVSLRTFSAKVRLAAGRPALGKVYLRGDALLD